MSLKIHDEFVQGSQAWFDARKGIVTASTVGQLITPKTVKPAANDTQRALLFELVAQRLSGFVEDTYQSKDMERGVLDEPYARDLYSKHYAPATTCGFMVENKWGYKIGYSPDGLVGSDGLIEIKSRRQKKHVQTILEDQAPLENMAQLQCGLLVSGRQWIDYVSYCSGMPLYVKRVFPDPQWHEAIVVAVGSLEQAAVSLAAEYENKTSKMPQTERIDHFQEMF